jgi:hypothetical protein
MQRSSLLARGALVVAALLVCVTAGVSGAHPEETLRQADRQWLAAQLQKERVAKSGLYGGDAVTTSYATRALHLLGSDFKLAEKAAKKTCKTLKATVDAAGAGEAANALQTAHAAIASKALACAHGGGGASVAQAVASLLSSRELVRIHAGVKAAVAADIGDADFAAALATLDTLREADVTYRFSVDEEDASLANVGYVWEIIGLLYEHAPALRAEVAKLPLELNKVLDVGVRPQRLRSVDFTWNARVGNLAAAAQVTRGFFALSPAQRKAASFKLDNAQFDALASLFVASRNVDEPREVFDALSALRHLADNDVYVPLIATVLTDKQSGAVTRVRVTNVEGATPKTAAKAKVYVATLRSSSGVTVKGVADVQLPLAGLGAYQLTMDALKKGAQPGFYDVVLSVAVSEKGVHRAHKTTRRVKVPAAVTGVSVSVYSSEAKTALAADRGAAAKGTHPAPLSSPVPLSDDRKWLHFNVAVDATAPPSQVFVQFRRNGKTAAFVCRGEQKKAKKKGTAQYYARINVMSPEFEHAVAGPGEYTVHVVVGDSLYAASLDWQVTSLTLPDLPPAMLSESKLLLPDIEHTFGAEPNRGGVKSFVLSLVFTGVCVAPLYALVVALRDAGIVLRWPASAAEKSAAIAFQTCIAATLVFLGIYWLSLTVLQALPVLGVLASLLFFTGQRALRDANQARMNKEEEQKKSN